PSY
ncbi:hCG2039689, partial [Homo sapiens]